VEQEVLPPGVEHGGHRDLRAEMLRIASDLQQGLRCRIEQDLVTKSLVAQQKGIQDVRHGEDDVEVRDREQAGQTLLQPLCTLRTLALWTVPVTAGVV